VPSQDIQILAQPDKNSAGKVYTTDLQERGIAEPQARYYDEAIRKGKTFIAVHIAVFNLKLSFDGSMLMVCPIYFQDKLVFQEVEDLGRHDGKIAVTAQ